MEPYVGGRMTTTKTYDYLNRLQSISSAPSVSSAVSFAYLLNAANQRRTNTFADSSYWVYNYDSLGQVTSGKKYWSDGTPVAGQQFEYNFDDIGNRRKIGYGGNPSGGDIRYANYTPNNLNQYTSREHWGYFNLIGTALTNATVSIWSPDGSYSLTSRHGEYYRGEMWPNN